MLPHASGASTKPTAGELKIRECLISCSWPAAMLLWANQALDHAGGQPDCEVWAAFGLFTRTHFPV